ncbi:hypothetical protein AtubIFM54640_001357 [Aspergillus tubingensis]|nr:hypothetical protein AtubIFM54640_001357 [Aspergillus tubingensis]
MSPEALATLLDEPALAAPSGVTANFDNPPNSNTLAWVGAYWGTAYAGYALIYTPGYYVHTWNLHNRDLIRPLYLILIYGCCYSAVLPLIKTAILLDWCRIFVPLNRTRNAFWWGCVSVITLQPHEAIWKFYLPSKCYSLPDVMLTSASVQVASDITMFFLPQRIIWRLQMNWQKKIGVSIIFGVGILASVAACFRLSHTVAFANTTDTMYLIGPLLFWACGEMTCGFFILSVPCLSKLIIESGLPRSVKQSLGFGSKPSEPSYEDSEQPHRSGQSDALRSHPMRPWLKGTDTIWSKIGDEDHDHDALRNSGKSESQTSLHRAQADGRS